MKYTIDIDPGAQQELKVLSGYVRAAALDLIRSLEVNPRPPRAKELRDKTNIYRIWLATRWRIAYEVDDVNQFVLILRVRRKEDIDYNSV